MRSESTSPDEVTMNSTITDPPTWASYSASGYIGLTGFVLSWRAVTSTCAAVKICRSSTSLAICDAVEMALGGGLRIRFCPSFDQITITPQVRGPMPGATENRGGTIEPV